MLTRAKKELIATTLTVKGQGETVTFNITFHNRKQSELEAEGEKEGATINKTLLYLVESWENEYPLTDEGIKEMEDDRPGITMAIIFAYHEARHVAKEKN
jgi:hypothetical protein